MIDLNASQASIRAGYSAKNADVSGPRLLVNVGIKNRIDELKAARSIRTQVTADRVLEELARIAYTPLTELSEWDSQKLEPVPSKDLTADQAASVKRVKFKHVVIRTKDGGEIETFEVGVEQHDKLSALDKLARHLNLYGEQDKGEKDSGLDEMIQQMARLRAEREGGE